MTEKSAWGKEDIGSIDILESGTIDVTKLVQSIDELKSGTISALKSVGGTIVSGAVSANTPPGTIDVSDFNKFSLVMRARPTTGATIDVTNQVREVSGGIWGDTGTTTVTETPSAHTITDVGKQYKPVPGSGGTLDVEYTKN